MMTSQYGQKIGKINTLVILSPYCSGIKNKCEGFYTWNNFNTALTEYNNVAKKSSGKYPIALDNMSSEDRAKNICALFGNANIETNQYKACKERVQIPDKGCPTYTPLKI